MLINFGNSFSVSFSCSGGGSSLGFCDSSNFFINNGLISCTCKHSGFTISLSLVIGFFFLLGSSLGITKSFTKSIVKGGVNIPGLFDSLGLADEGKNCE